MAVSSVKELKKNRHFSWTRIKNQFLGIVGNPFNVIVFFTLIILFVLIIIPLLIMVQNTFVVAKAELRSIPGAKIGDYTLYYWKYLLASPLTKTIFWEPLLHSLIKVDRHFAASGVPYARYSDDMILFAPTREELQGHIETLKSFLVKYRLEPNPTKERVYSPGEPFDFLGFKCLGRTIDIADSSKHKMKDRIRRRARALHRWQSMNGIEPDRAMKALINSFNRKFFEGDDPHTLTWSRWFFPIINSTAGLKEIDRCLQMNLRYLASGKHNKANYRVRYEKLKSLGYKSLVHEYYIFRK